MSLNRKWIPSKMDIHELEQRLITYHFEHKKLQNKCQERSLTLGIDRFVFETLLLGRYENTGKLLNLLSSFFLICKMS